MSKNHKTIGSEKHVIMQSWSIEISLSEDELGLLSADQLQKNKSHAMRSERVSIALTPFEFKLIRYRAKKANQPCGTYCRQVILKKKVFYRLTQSEIKTYELVTEQINLLKILIEEQGLCKSIIREIIEIKESIKQLVQNSFHK